MNLMLSIKGHKYKYMAHEILTWNLKRRIKWTELGDAKNKFFHSYASTLRNFNAIWALKNEEDVLVEGNGQLKELGVKHFSEIFKDEGNTRISDQLKVIHLFPTLVDREEATIFTLK